MLSEAKHLWVVGIEILRSLRSSRMTHKIRILKPGEHKLIRFEVNSKRIQLASGNPLYNCFIQSEKGIISGDFTTFIEPHL